MCVNEKKLTADQIKKIVNGADLRDYPDLIRRFSEDDRKAVQKIIVKMQNDLEKFQNEKKRILAMKSIEDGLRKKGYTMICGIDEVGRGPLAGPVVAAAVILPKESNILYVNDSKKLSATKREELARQIIEEAVAWGIGMESPEKIDEVNILEATKLAMSQAVDDLKIAPDILLIDALQLPSSYPVKAVIHGDAICYSIAAASIVAKVYRDDIMKNYHHLYPEYGFDANMGYGTAGHIAALKQYGPTPIHRRSFIQKFV